MRIAFVLDGFPSISETFITNQITGLLDKGVGVTIFAEKNPGLKKIHQNYYIYQLGKRCSYEPPWPASWLSKLLISIVLVFNTLVKSPKIFLKLFLLKGRFFNHRYLRAVQPFLKPQEFDIIHAHFGPMGIKAVDLHKMGLLKGTIICSFHGYDVDQNNYRNNSSIYTDLFATAAYITANSFYTARNIEALNCPATKIKVLPESLDTSLFKKEKERAASEIVKLITVARLVEFKGIEYSIRAAGELVKQGITNFEYFIIGDGPLRKQLEQLIFSLGLHGHVHLLGSKTQEEIVEWLGNSDIFVLTGISSSDGRQENQGLVIQEAQSMELPVVVSSIGGVPEGILDGISGFLIQEKDFASIASQLKVLMADQTLRKEMGKAGRSFVQNKFDTSIICDRLKNIYLDVLDNKVG